MAARLKRKKGGKQWSRGLGAPLAVTGIMVCVTLADVRALITRHLPKAYRSRPHWQMAAEHLEAAAAGGDIEEAVLSVSVAFLIEGIRCERQPVRRPRIIKR
jgi:hypothetical protein